MLPARNLEFKCYYSGTQDAEALCNSLGATFLASHTQVDTYFMTSRGRLKIRETDVGREIIYYERLNSVNPKESVYLKTRLGDDCSIVKQLLEAALGSPVTVRKRRTVLATASALVNLDTVDNVGTFVEVEVQIERAGSIDRAYHTANQLKTALGVTYPDMIPFSYADLVLMKKASGEWHEALSAVDYSGRLYFLDGVSGAGKSSLLYAILEDKSLDMHCVPRHTTRALRSDASESECIFVPPTQFHNLVLTGAFFEFRDFEFGMSYGLTWDMAMTPLLSGHNAIGIINFGNVRHVAELLPEATRILVDAPLQTIEKRLRNRGHNTEEQIQERLANARLVEAYRSYYDYVINNDDGLFDGSVAMLKNIICPGPPI